MTDPTTPSANRVLEARQLLQDAWPSHVPSGPLAEDVLDALAACIARALSERDTIIENCRNANAGLRDGVGNLQAQLREREREKDGETLRANTYLDKVKELKREVERLREALERWSWRTV